MLKTAPADIPLGEAALRVPCEAGSFRIAALAMTAYALLVLALIPLARLQGPAMPQIVAVFTTGIVVCDLATAYMLLQQLRATPMWSALLIACAYLFSGLMGAAHLLTYPGALLLDRPVIGRAQLATYVYDCWRLGYGLPVLAAAYILDRPLPAPRARALGLWLPVCVVALVFLGVTAGATWEARLPTMIANDHYSDISRTFNAVGVTFAMVACAWMWATRSRHSLFHLWLALAVTTFTGDILLASIGGARYSLGFYVGRASGLVSGCTLFLFFLRQSAEQQRLTALTAQALGERTRSLQAEIARRAEAEERLAQAQKLEAMGQLTGGIAHDFNNLLAAVVGNLELLKRRAGLQDRPARWLANALDAAERGAKLTAQLLVFARTQRLEIAPVDLQALIMGAQDILTRALGPDIALTIDFAARPGLVIAEPNQLELAVLNLFINARDAMPNGGRLVLSTQDVTGHHDLDLETGAYVLLTVKDTGMGMPPEVLRRVFDPFFTTKEAGKGSGLGLSQVFGFARRVGGAVRIDSAPGQGATVRLYLRRTDAAPTDVEAQGLMLPLPPLDGPALVVDDDPAVREMLVAWLNELGVQTLEAADGPSGQALALQTRPALLLVDFSMPGMNGARLAQQVRALYPRLPVVFVTGYADTDAIQAAVGEEAPILRKPFKPADLAAALARAVKPI